MRPTDQSSTTEITSRLRKIIETEFNDGDRLPSEVKLAESLGVSRPKLREAFGQLWQAGLIEKKWGVGTIVRKRHDLADYKRSVLLPLPHIRSATALIRESGQEPSASDVSIRLSCADSIVGQLLDIGEGDEFWIIDRVVRANKLPVQRTIDAVPAVIEGVNFDASGFDALNNTLLSMFQAQLKSTLAKSDGRLSVVPAPKDTADALEIREDEPTLLAEYTTYTDRGTIVSYTTNWYLPSRIDMRFSAERPAAIDFRDSILRSPEKHMPPTSISSHLSQL